MSHWPSVRARVLLQALMRRGWQVKRQTGSHRTLSRAGDSDFVFAFHDGEEVGPRMLARIAKQTGLTPRTCSARQPQSGAGTHRMNAPPVITDTDLKRLADFLSSDAAPETAMDVSTLEGFLTALVIGPRMVMPSAWMPWVWDFANGREDPEFADMAQAQEVLGLVMGLMNRIAGAFERAPASFEPVFLRDVAWGAAEWCEGFLAATQRFDAKDWTMFWLLDASNRSAGADSAGLITPFLRLGDEAGFEITRKEGNAQRWVDAIVPSLAAIHAYWLERRPARPGIASRAPARREAPKVGRNDPCPCGSGQKYKKCCGQASTVH